MAAFEFIETPDSRQYNADGPSLSLVYSAIGEANEQTVMAFAYAATPTVYSTTMGVLHRQPIQLQPRSSDVFTVTIPYGLRNRELGSWDWDFDTSGGTITLKTSKSTLGYPVGLAPDHKGAIGVHGDEVDGAEIVIPALRINVNFKHPAGVLSMTRVKQLARWTGKVNSASFMGFDAGEVLFLGARGRNGSDAACDVSYNFAMSENATINIGDIVGVIKQGWEHVWVSFKDDVDGGNPVKQPQYAYVEQVYDTFDMAAELGFG